LDITGSHGQWDSAAPTGAKCRLIGVGVVLVHAVKMQVEVFLSRASQDLFSRYGDRAQIPPRRNHIKNCQDTFYLAQDSSLRTGNANAQPSKADSHTVRRPSSVVRQVRSTLLGLSSFWSQPSGGIRWIVRPPVGRQSAAAHNGGAGTADASSDRVVVCSGHTWRLVYRFHWSRYTVPHAPPARLKTVRSHREPSLESCRRGHGRQVTYNPVYREKLNGDAVCSSI
jgi:hypothetical protein